MVLQQNPGYHDTGKNRARAWGAEGWRVWGFRVLMETPTRDAIMQERTKQSEPYRCDSLNPEPSKV